MDSAHATLQTSLADMDPASRRAVRSSDSAHRSEGGVSSVAKDHHATAWSLIPNVGSTLSIAPSSALRVTSAGNLPAVAYDQSALPMPCGVIASADLAAARSSARHVSSPSSHPNVAHDHITFAVSTAFISPRLAALTTVRSVASHASTPGCQPILAKPHRRLAVSTPDIPSATEGSARSSEVNRSYTPVDVISTASASTAAAME